MGDLIAALRTRDLKAVRAAIAADPKAARGARAIVEAGRLAFQPALALLVKAGADLNATFRNYRPLHALLQEDPHAAAGKQSLGAWPSARGIVVAGFVGVPEYVQVLRK